MSSAIVLMVDDNADDRMLFKLACRAGKVDFEFRAVEDGDGAIAYLEQARKDQLRERNPIPALILLDLKMPGMDGFEATRRIRARTRERVPIIALTAAAGGSDRKLAMDAGMDDFVSKPLTRRDFAEVLGRWLERPGHEQRCQAPRIR